MASNVESRPLVWSSNSIQSLPPNFVGSYKVSVEGGKIQVNVIDLEKSFDRLREWF